MMQAYNSFDYPHHPHHPYLAAPDGSQNFTNGFSRGSSFTYPHQDYRYFVDRGELASRLCTTSLVDNNSLDATGIGFAGNPSSGNTFIVPEDISVYNQWDWSPAAHPIVAPAPVYPPPQVFSSVKSNRNPPSSSTVCSPTAQLPTPAAMAVLLNPNGRSSQVGDHQHHQHQQQQSQLADYEIPQGSAMMISHHTSVTARPIRPVEPVVAVQGVPDSPSREKKHACTMCHKRQVLFFFFFRSY